MDFNAILNWIIVNSPFIIMLIVLVVLAVRGYKVGLVAEICNLVSALIASIAILLLAIAIKGVFDQEKIQLVVAIVLIVLLAIVFNLLSLFFGTLKLVSNIPVLNLINKTCGIIIAVAETVVILWAVYCVVDIVDGGIMGTWINNCIEVNPLMATLKDKNLLASLINFISSKF